MFIGNTQQKIFVFVSNSLGRVACHPRHPRPPVHASHHIYQLQSSSKASGGYTIQKPEKANIYCFNQENWNRCPVCKFTESQHLASTASPATPSWAYKGFVSTPMTVKRCKFPHGEMYGQLHTKRSRFISISGLHTSLLFEIWSSDDMILQQWSSTVRTATCVVRVRRR